MSENDKQILITTNSQITEFRDWRKYRFLVLILTIGGGLSPYFFLISIIL